jgi:hypothetical protein
MVTSTGEYAIADQLRAWEADLPWIASAVVDQMAKQMPSDRVSGEDEVMVLLHGVAPSKGPPLPRTERYGD